jgi:Ca2+-binding RTX toxin-like protein
MLGFAGYVWLICGGGSDTLSGGDGDDTLTWVDGDGSDRIEGGAGSDTVRVEGAGANDVFAITPNSARFTIDHSAPVSSLLDIGTTERVVLIAGAGDDTIAVIPLFTTSILVDGGAHSAGDTLNFNRQGMPLAPVPAPPEGTITLPGRQPVSYVRIEKITVVSTAPAQLRIFLPLARS